MQTNVKRRPFGKTGINVSEISFGAMNLRRLPDLDSVNKLINDILDQGINLIDTARAYDTGGYGNYTIADGPFISSELELGKAISARTDINEPLVIVTKGHGYTPDEFDSHFNESCQRLQIRKEGDKLYIGQTEIILVYLLHGLKPDRWEIITGSGVLAHAEKRKREGRYHFLGFSSHYPDREVIIEAIKSGYFQACELPYHVYNDSLGDIIKLAYDHGMGIINMKAFGGTGMGLIFKNIQDLTGIGYADMARFCVSSPYISTIDAGVRSIDEFLVDVSAAAEPHLSVEELTAMSEKASKITPHLNATCRECMHCVEKFECPQSVDFPRILGLHGRYVVSKALGFDTSQYKSEYAAFAPDASVCTACGGCNEWCEYKLDIPELLKNAAADLG